MAGRVRSGVPPQVQLLTGPVRPYLEPVPVLVPAVPGVPSGSFLLVPDAVCRSIGPRGGPCLLA